MAMQDYEIPVREDSLEGHALAGIAPGHVLEICDEAGPPVLHVRIVLDIDVACIPLDGLAGACLIESQIIKGRHRLLVAL